MKVILVNDQLSPGGAERVLVNTANLLYENGVTVEVLLYLGKKELDNQLNLAIPIHYLQRSGRFDFAAMHKLKQIVCDADIIHVHSRYNLRYLMVAKMFFSFKKPAIVFHEHMPSFTLDTFTKYLFKKIDAYIAVDKKMTDWMKTNGIISKEKIFYLPNVVATPLQVKQNYQSTYKIVMVGNFWHPKNQIFALKVLLLLPQKYQLDIYGMVYEENYYQQLLESIEVLGLTKRVNIIKGMTNVYSVLEQYDFALHTSIMETGPLVLIEFMNFGLPFIASNAGDVARQVSETVPEIIIAELDNEVWKKQINYLFATENERKNLGIKLKKLAHETFSEKKYLADLQNIYKLMLISKN